MAEYGYVVGWLKVREVGCGWDGKQLRVVGWESRWDGICRHTTNWQLMGCTNHSDGDGMVACDGNEIPRPIPSHPITIPFVMVIPSHRITTHSPEFLVRSSLFIKMEPGFTVNHRKLRALENTIDVLIAQERLLADLRESVKPLELLKAEWRGVEDMDGALSLHARPREANV